MKLKLSKRCTLSQLVDFWYENYAKPNFSPITYIKEYKTIKSRVIPKLGKYKLYQLNYVTLTNFFNELKESNLITNNSTKKINFSTVVKIKQILSTVLQYACSIGILNDNPCLKVKLKNQKSNSYHVNYYDKQTYLKVLDCLKNEEFKHRVLIEFALKTGLRKSEVFALTWKDINLNEKGISINKSRHYIKELGYFIKSTKTPSSNRVISISDNLITLLLEYKQKYGELEYVFDTINMNSINDWFKNFQKRNNIEPIIKFHDLRHTHATLLLLQGVDIKTIQTRLRTREYFNYYEYICSFFKNFR